MPRPRKSVPAYRLHKQSGQAITTVRLPDGSRRDILLGPYASAESRQRYLEVLADPIKAAGFQASPADPFPLPCPSKPLTVADVLLAYVTHAAGYYRDPETDKPTSHFNTVKLAVRAVRTRFAALPAADFRPPQLIRVRDDLVAAGLSRKEVNKRVGVVKMIFCWAAAEADLIPAETAAKLRLLKGLRAGRTAAPERPRVRPVDPALVDKTLPLLPREVAALVELLRLTGGRCGELVRLRPRDLDRSGPVWEFTPAAHKTAWQGKPRVIYIGARAQAVLAEWLLRCGGPDEYVFSPRRAEAERNAARSAARVTPRYPSHVRRNATKRVGTRRTRPPGDRYCTRTVANVIRRACRAAGLAHWHPHQLRHLAATRIRAEFGIDVARAVLGHSMAAMSEHYSREADRGLALRAVAAVG